jgi:toxin ParE1/3/4
LAGALHAVAKRFEQIADKIDIDEPREMTSISPEHDSAAARRVALHIPYCVENLLSEDPRLGAPGRVPGTRELVIPKTPYVVPYRIRGRTIEIARVYHSSRRWPERP